MSTSLLFGAGAIVTFITLWGVLMATGLSATRHQPPDDANHAPTATPIVDTAPVAATVEGTSHPISPRLLDG